MALFSQPQASPEHASAPDEHDGSLDAFTAAVVVFTSLLVSASVGLVWNIKRSRRQHSLQDEKTHRLIENVVEEGTRDEVSVNIAAA